uniref:Ig-like domain-containing protein n=1 Tax=Salarias fasciatus TaxID=181472 RepID=A0A672GXT4_SALFA
KKLSLLHFCQRCSLLLPEPSITRRGKTVAPCDQLVPEGQDVVISAKVRGQPKPMVYWSKDGVPVKMAGRFAVREIEDDTSELVIGSAQRSDTGRYVCKIVNEYGSEQAECRVELRGE